MWKISELKKDAKGALKRNYWCIIIVCVLISIIMGNFINPVSRFQQILEESKNETVIEDTILVENNDVVESGRQDITSNTEIVDSFLGGVGMEADKAKKWTNGVLSMFANNSQGAGSVLYGIMNTINQMVFNDRIGSSIIIALGVLIALAILIFIKNVIRVGYCRFFLETRVYNKTHSNRVLFPWHIKRGAKIAWIMFVKNIYMLFWMFTIIGGVIKHYSYKMVPYIIAENPNMKANEAISLSRKMMNGHKWRTFLMDLSFIPWNILNGITCCVLDIFFLNAYKRLTYAELYTSLKKIAKVNNIPNADKLCDEMLDVEVQDAQYPTEKYIIPIVKGRQWAHADYDRKYTLTSLILIFFTFSFVGWVWEVSLHLFKEGVFINRGVSYGPWLPIYGTGGVLVLVLLKKLRKNPALTFLATMVVCGIVEYFTSLFLEVTKGLKWWDYSGYFMNLNGRICLEGLLVFALGGCAAIYLIAPALDNLFKKIPKNVKITICSVLLAVFFADQIYAHFYPNTGKGITDYDTSMIHYKIKTAMNSIKG